MPMRIRLLALLLFFSCCSLAQTSFRVMSYNVENLFDCDDDSLTFDEDFTPEGAYHWTPNKLKQKIAKIAKVITIIGQWEPPALVGLCEVENENVIKKLVYQSPLKEQHYSYVHFESPDKRGIDVALLYQRKSFEPLEKQNIPIHYPENKNLTTRDILYVKGVVLNKDTLHVFVCHFPSRLGGELESEDNRKWVASVLRQHVDSVLAERKKANILIMGDFNDYPNNESLLNVLKSKEIKESKDSADLYNLYYELNSQPEVGTHKNQGEWGVLDQMMVSKNLLQPSSILFTSQENVHIFDADFLLQDDEHFLGKKPFRTFLGMKYMGGFSDHLPIYVDFFLQEKDK